jgi:hypothetical protein
MAETNSTHLAVPIQNLEFTDYILNISVIDRLKLKLPDINLDEIEIRQIGADTPDSVKIKNLKSYIKIVEYFLSNHEKISVEDKNLLSPLILKADNTPFFNYSQLVNKTDIQYIVAICYFKLLLLQLNIDILNTFISTNEIYRQNNLLFVKMKEELEGIITDAVFFNQLLNHSQDDKIYIKTIYELYLNESNKEIEFLVSFIQDLKKTHQFKNIKDALTEFNASRKPQTNASPNNNVETAQPNVETTQANNNVETTQANNNVETAQPNNTLGAVPTNPNVVTTQTNTTVTVPPKPVVTKTPSNQVTPNRGQNGTLGMNRPTLRKDFEDLKNNFVLIKSDYERKIKSERDEEKRKLIREETALKLQSYLKKIKEIKQNMKNSHYYNHNSLKSRNISDPNNIPNSIDQLEENIVYFQIDKSLISLSDQYENLESLFEEKRQLYKTSLVVDVLTGHVNQSSRNFINNKQRALTKLTTIIIRINELKEKIAQSNNNTKSTLTDKINFLKTQVEELKNEIETAEKQNNESLALSDVVNNSNARGTYMEVTSNLRRNVTKLPQLKPKTLSEHYTILLNKYNEYKQLYEKNIFITYNKPLHYQTDGVKSQFYLRYNSLKQKLEQLITDIRKIIEDPLASNNSDKTEVDNLFILFDNVNELLQNLIDFKYIKENSTSQSFTGTNLQKGGFKKKTHKLSLNHKLKSKHKINKITKSTKHKMNKTIKHKMNKSKLKKTHKK